MKNRFTLVEVLLAVALLAFGMVGVVAAYHRAAFTLGRAQENILAYALLREKLGALEAEAREQEGLMRGSFEGRFGGTFEGYDWQLVVQEGRTDETDEVRLTVRHVRSERAYTLATILPRPVTPE